MVATTSCRTLSSGSLCLSCSLSAKQQQSINQSLLVLLGHTEEKITGEHSHLEIANASHAGHAEKNIYII